MTTTHPKISIIIPIYNTEKYIKQCLDSILNQTFNDLEIIIVDDCSSDKSLEIIQEYAKNDKRFTIIKQEINQGQGVARNRALDIAHGEYVMFLDPDDWLETTACEKAYNQISTNKNDMVFFALYSWKERKNNTTNKELNTTRLLPFEEVKNNPHVNLQNLQTNWFIGGWTWVQIYSTDFLNKNNIRYSNHRYAEDLAFITKAMVKSKDISILNEPLYNYRKRSSRSTVYTNNYKDVLETKILAYEIIKESGCSENILNNFLIYEINSNIMHFKKYTKANKNIANDFYFRIKKRLEELSKILSQETLKKINSSLDFDLILKCKTFKEYKIKRLFKKLFLTITLNNIFQ